MYNYHVLSSCRTHDIVYCLSPPLCMQVSGSDSTPTVVKRRVSEKTDKDEASDEGGYKIARV